MSPSRAGPLPEPVFRIASPRGDLPFTPDLAELPLEGCPLSTSYGDYFSGLGAFCQGPGLEPILAEASRIAGRPLAPEGITGLGITAQKHGALYHPASLEVGFSGGMARLGANVATSPHGWAAMAREWEALRRVRRARPGEGLPRPLAFEEGDRMDILLVEWLSGFHEFHVTAGGELAVWDYDGGGIRPLSPDAAREATRQAARLLTRCLDLKTGARIWPWRHAAGDFVIQDDPVRVRLITARDYAPSAVGGGVAGLRHFVLTTSLFLRLDRVDGVGECVFLPDWSLAAAVSGILDGLAGRSAATWGVSDPVAAVAGVPPRDWRRLLEADADFMSDPDLPFLDSHLDRHLDELNAMWHGLTVG